MIAYENLSQVNAEFSEEFQQKFKENLATGWFILGKEVESFEKEFAAYCETPYFVGVASGLDALTLSLRLCDFPKGSEVIVPSNTYIATILSIIYCDLVPVLVEPDRATYNLDPNLIEERITPKTKAIMPVHLYGKCCQMDKISQISEKHNLRIIEDCAQAHGAKFKGVRAGNFGDFGAFSFFPTKNLGALGDAGGVTLKNEEDHRVLKQLRFYGFKERYVCERIGYNSRLDEIQAAFLRIKLRKLDQLVEHKRALAQMYLAGLKEDFIKPVVDKDYEDVYHIFNIRHPRRDELRDYLTKHGVGTNIHYPVAPHDQKAIKDTGLFVGQEFPISSEIHNTTLSLPISFMTSPQDVEKVIEIMNQF